MTDELARALGAHVALTHILVVADIDRSRAFWVDIMSADLYRKYGGTSVVLRFAGGWLLLVTGGGPTADKPDTIFAPPAEGIPVSHAMTVRVADCPGVYEALRARGAGPLTAPPKPNHPALAPARTVSGGSGRAAATPPRQHRDEVGLGAEVGIRARAATAAEAKPDALQRAGAISSCRW